MRNGNRAVFGKSASNSLKGFTLIEVMVSAALLTLLVVVTAGIVSATQNVYGQASAQIEQFRKARQAFDLISRRLAQATLNPYWAVSYDAKKRPLRYERASNLRFLSGRAFNLVPGAAEGGSAVFFQSPTGFFSDGSGDLGAALNTWGYFVEYGSDAEYRPEFLNNNGYPLKYRFRLVEFLDPSDKLAVFGCTSGNPDYSGLDWFLKPLTDDNTDGAKKKRKRILADNVIAFVVLPKVSTLEDSTGAALAPQLSYDSTDRVKDPRFNPRNQLPPVLEIAAVVVDERSAGKLKWEVSPPDLGVNLATLFTDALKLDEDLETLRTKLAEKRLDVRVLRQTVPLISARWSTEQQK